MCMKSVCVKRVCERERKGEKESVGERDNAMLNLVTSL